MNLIFMKHGEATDNVKGLISNKEIYWSILTNEGIKNVVETVDLLSCNIDVCMFLLFLELYKRLIMYLKNTQISMLILIIELEKYFMVSILIKK